MKNIKKIDDFDFVFINKSLTDKEDKEFSDFLRNRNIKSKQKNVLKPSIRKLKALVQA
jgi:hypothetical protein